MLDIGVETSPGMVSVVLSGEFDLASAVDVERELREIERERPGLLVFDLRGLSFLDSTGLRVIVSADSRARREGGRVAVVQGPEQVHRVFRIALLDKRLEFVNDPSALKETSAGTSA